MRKKSSSKIREHPVVLTIAAAWFFENWRRKRLDVACYCWEILRLVFVSGNGDLSMWEYLKIKSFPKPVLHKVLKWWYKTQSLSEDIENFENYIPNYYICPWDGIPRIKFRMYLPSVLFLVTKFLPQPFT